MQQLLKRVLEYGSINLFKISQDKKEFKKLRRTITSENKQTDFNPEQINEVLRAHVSEKYAGLDDVILIHDPSEIRKPYSKHSEHLGKVRALDNTIINGYSSFNTIAIEPFGKQINLVDHELYSNRQPDFLSQSTVNELTSGKKAGGLEEIRGLYESDAYITKKRMALSHIEATSKAMKAKNSQLNITHVLDREFDDGGYFSFINALDDAFIIRAKKSRTTASLSGDIADKEKLIAHEFTHSHTMIYKKLYLSGRCFQDCRVELEWTDFGDYRAVLVHLFDRSGKAVFEAPMLLITNKKIHNPYDAFEVYSCYLKRARIEGVFKFMKEAMGWESFRLQDFNGIKALVAVGFFVASYLYEISKKEVYDDFVVLVAEAGSAENGKVTRHYILEGIKAILTKYRVDRVFNRNKPDEETLHSIHDMVGYDGQ